MSHKVFVDWGTTSFRAYLVDETGRVAGRSSGDDGVRVAAGRFEAVLRAHIGPWLGKHSVSTIVCAGMVGSDLGWLAVDMAPCPAGVDTVAAGLRPIPSTELPEILIVPGLSCHEPDGSIGMMRGEEVALFGALALQERTEGLFCFPGTHSKWVAAREGAVRSIRTCMTGECFELLRRHSVLARSLEGWSGDIAEEDFLAGVAMARQVRNPLQAAFSVRALHLHGGLPTVVARASYLSGVLIGSEIAGFMEEWLRQDGALTLVCEQRLADLYELACGPFDLPVARLDEESCFVAGCSALLRCRPDDA